MNSMYRTTAIAALGVAMATAVTIDTAEAQRVRTRNLIIGGVVAGAIIAGAAAANARGTTTYVERSSSCGDYRRKAIWNEENGNPRRAAYWWDRHAECRGE